MSTAPGHAGGVPLEEYRKDIPPGWEPNLVNYPLKLYMERVQLWYRVYEGADESVGPLLAGRLRGRAQQIALGLRLPEPNGHIDTGDAALVRLSVDEVRDPSSGIIIQQAIPSGVQALMSALRAAFGEADQLQATRALETFLEFKRQRMTLPERSVQWQLNLDEAMTHSGLELNNVAKTYLYFKSSGLNQKSLDDLLLQIHGDMRRFEEVRTLMSRMAHRNIDSGSNAAHYEEITMDDASSWSAVTDMWSSDADDTNYYMEELYAWNEDDGWHSQPQPWDHDYAETCYEEWPDYDYGWNDDEAPLLQKIISSTRWQCRGVQGLTPTMGLGCSTCGSKWHNTHACPMNDTYKGKMPMKGKGKSTGYGKGKGKSYGGKPYGGKPYGKKGFGKSKSYGKGGYGNRQGCKGFWLEDMPKNFNDYYGGAYLLSNNSLPEKEDADKLDKVIIRDTFNEVEPLPTRRVRFSDVPEGDQADDTTTKKLNFPVTEDVGEMVFHQVRGRRVR